MEPMSRDQGTGGKLLGVTVFLAGAAVLILEIQGARLLAPFFGTSQGVWSAIIAVTLLALSVGYRLGGAAADRREPAALLYRALVVAGWLVLLIPMIRRVVLPWASAFGLQGGALLAAVALLAPSLAVLGCVAPLAARTATGDLGRLGTTVGSLYALSTVGSLAGALAAGYWLTPWLGTVRILLVTALLLFLPAGLYWWGAARGSGRSVWRLLTAGGAIAALAGLAMRGQLPIENPADGWALLSREDSAYSEVKVARYRTGQVLVLDGTLQTGVDSVSGAPMFPYALAAPALLAAAVPKAKRMCLIGFGGGTVALVMAQRGIAVESVEIDPAVAEAARRFFLGGARLPVAVEDGRVFMRRTPPGHYDAVFLDAYAGEAPPAHLFTLEAWWTVRRTLAPGGAGMANLIGFTDGPDARLARCVMKTLKEVFPWVEAYRVEENDGITNILFVFGETPRRLAGLTFPSAHPQIGETMRGLLRRRVTLEGDDAFVLTDDFCPLETLAAPSRAVMRANMRALFPAWVLLG